MFHVRRRPADCAPRKRKKKPGALGTNAGNLRDGRGEAAPLLVELGPDGSAPHPSDTARTIRLANDVMEVIYLPITPFLYHCNIVFSKQQVQLSCAKISLMCLPQFYSIIDQSNYRVAAWCTHVLDCSMYNLRFFSWG